MVLWVSRRKKPTFFPAAPFFNVLLMKCLLKYPDSKKTPLPWKIPGYAPERSMLWWFNRSKYLNGRSNLNCSYETQIEFSVPESRISIIVSTPIPVGKCLFKVNSKDNRTISIDAVLVLLFLTLNRYLLTRIYQMNKLWCAIYHTFRIFSILVTTRVVHVLL